MIRYSLFIIILAWLTSTSGLMAQTPISQPEQPTSSGVTPDQIKSQLKLVEETESLDPKIKETLIGQFKLALERLDSAARYKLEADQYRQSIETSAEAIKSFKNQLEALPSLIGASAQTNHIADIKGDISSKELEQLLTSEKAKLTDLRSAISTVEAYIQAQSSRPEKNRQEQEEARKKLTEINTALSAPPPENEKPQEARARLTLLEARRQARNNEIVKLEQEATSHDLRLNLKKSNPGFPTEAGRSPGSKDQVIGNTTFQCATERSRFG